MTDLSDLDLQSGAEQGATMTARHPVTDEILLGDDKEPMTITVLGGDSQTFKRAISDITKANSKKRNVSVADQERNTVLALVRITTGWSDNWTWDGEKFPFSKENAQRLYTERAWTRTQIDEFMGDRANFFKAD